MRRPGHRLPQESWLGHRVDALKPEDSTSFGCCGESAYAFNDARPHDLVPNLFDTSVYHPTTVRDIYPYGVYGEGMETTTFQVLGMTCGHCASSVEEELRTLPEVATVEVTLDTGNVTVTSTSALDPESIVAAVVEAGYSVAT